MKTLSALNKNWIFWLDRAGIYTLPIGGLLALFLVFTHSIPLYLSAAVTVFLSLFFAIAHHICLYYFVKCPSCGWNLSTFKSGTKIPPKDVYNAFRNGKACLNCGWKPE